ncbi:c-type cytochrome [Flavilitoribacter nigricans]|uniref:Cytochrome C n=1 Tax=Flavilitoribacter nigricans (strain ATCC 23147 / DSM 23189 / NBRC 102662 / NCIMB 1420 / SS-2) TaxID=1122177 RepID=A0A2D0NC74_FLAN2|nr:cytochrome c [Flavilitoribacter nigricans]PHN06102.1 cytochrome C [Flavilitoribacter nigricans DSM 23189 = NBRC 102662]
MKSVVKLLKWTGIVLVLIIVGVFAFVQFTWGKKHDAPYPEIMASTDSVVIARGKHLALGPAHCISCHVPMDKVKEAEDGKVMPLSGGWELSILPGVFRAPNITPDMETGIGRMTDGEIARTLRYSVNKNHGLVFPFMPFQELSDEDLVAIISFLRSQEPVRHKVEPTEYSFLGKALIAFGIIKPEGPKNTPPQSVEIDSTIAYGSYLANRVANCNGCHTERDLKTGDFIGAPFAGGTLFMPDGFTEGYSFVTPNLTPHKGTGIMASWDESTFIKRMRVGRVHKGSPMPWATYERMEDLELKAIYRFLQSLDPVHNKIEKIVFEPGEEYVK